MREYKKLSQKAYNQKAYNYEGTFDGKFTSAFKVKLIKEIKIYKDDKVLDVACGTGTLLNELLKLYDFKAYGIDIAENMIKVAKNNYPSIEFQVSDSSRVDFNDDFFNVITVCASFHHFPDPQQFINEAARVLARNGRIYIAEIYVPGVIRQVFNVFLPFSSSGDVKFYSPKEIITMFENANLTDFKISRKGYIQIISAKK